MARKRAKFALLRLRKGEDRLNGEINLVGLTLAEARQLTGQKGSPMRDSYPVPSSLIKQLQGYTTEQLDAGSFDYFLERQAEDAKCLVSLSPEEPDELEKRALAAAPGPWVALLERRDFTSG